MSEFLEKVPPHSHEAEQATLGAVILERSAAAHAIDTLTAADFYDGRHGSIFEAATELFADGAPIDLVTMTERLRGRGDYDRVGGQAYLVDLLEAVPTAATVAHYAGIVKDLSARRGLIVMAHRLIHHAYSDADKDTNALVEHMRRGLELVERKSDTQEVPSLSEVLHESFLLLEKGTQPHRRVVTGFSGLDDLVLGIEPGDLALIAARPSVGKTALSLHLAMVTARRNIGPVYFASLEMTRQQLGLRLVASDARVPLRDVRMAAYDDRQVEALQQSAARLAEYPVYVDDSRRNTPGTLAAKARRLKDRHGLALVLVDYVQLLRAAGKHDGRHDELSHIVWDLKAMAGDLGVPVVVMSQLNREVERREHRRPRLSDLRESGTLEEHPDTILLLYRPGVRHDEVDACYSIEQQQRLGLSGNPNRHEFLEVIVAKQRNGPVGTAYLGFHTETQNFYSWSIPDGS